MATSPARVPFASIDGSGLPYLRHTYSIAVSPPAAPASIVFVAMTPMRRSEPASVDPALNPNHPKARMNVPTNAIGMLWPGIAFAVPSRLYLPRRGPRRIAVTNRHDSARHVHDGRSGEVDVAVAQPEVLAEHRRASRRPRSSCA